MTFQDFTPHIVPLILSTITIFSLVWVGNKRPSGWLLCALSQIIWLGWIVSTKNWGFLPMNLALTLVYVRNYRKWLATAGANEKLILAGAVSLLDEWDLNRGYYALRIRYSSGQELADAYDSALKLYTPPTKD